MQIICDKCKAEILPQQETIRNGELEHTFFRCSECDAVYQVCATDEALRKNIAYEYLLLLSVQLIILGK